MIKTYQPNQQQVKRSWHLVDMKDQILGRSATQIATFLMGKQKSDYSAHMDSGDYVVVVNAKDLVLTGNKVSQKVYRSHSGYPGGFKEVSYEKMSQKFPERIVEKAVAGMLPDNRLKADRMTRLFVFAGNKHKYESKFK
jgi:large subunit ribosomal protein L13